MKRELFNVADEEFITLLSKTHEGFGNAGLRYMFVGGVAVQLHVAKLLCDIHKDNLINIVRSGKIRVQDYFRSTDDVDIVIKPIEKESDESKAEIKARQSIFSALDYIVKEELYISPTGDHLINIEIDKRGHVKPTFRLSVDGVGDRDKAVDFNIYRKPKDLRNTTLKEFENSFFDIFLNGSVKLDLPYSSAGDISLRIKNKEHLLATKIALGRKKDFHDALSLVEYSNMANQGIEYPVVEHILCSEDQRYHIKSEELCRRYEAFRNLEKTLK